MTTLVSQLAPSQRLAQLCASWLPTLTASMYQLMVPVESPAGPIGITVRVRQTRPASLTPGWELCCDDPKVLSAIGLLPRLVTQPILARLDLAFFPEAGGVVTRAVPHFDDLPMSLANLRLAVGALFTRASALSMLPAERRSS